MIKTVLVTGAFGNIGCFVLEALIDQGYLVIAVDKPGKAAQISAERFTHPAVQIVWSDICCRASIAEAVSRADAVIHLAAVIPPVSESHPKLTRAVNIDATRQLIEVMEQSPGPKRLVFASSTAIFGKIQTRDRPLTATDTPAPDDHYGRSKVECEALLQACDLDWSILRIAACPAVNINGMASTRDIAIFDNHPDGRIELIHPADAGLAFANAVSCDESIHKILYLGGGQDSRMYVIDLFNQLFTTLGFAPLPREAFRITPSIECYGEWVDTGESQALLEFQRHNASSIFSDLKDSLGAMKYLSVLIRAVSGLATRALLLTSPYYKQQAS